MKKIILIFIIIFCSLQSKLISKNNSDISEDTLLYKINKLYDLQLGMWETYKTKHASIVMFGNSITHGCSWNELLGRSDVVDRGIPSDNLVGYLARIDYIFRLHPRVCFIMGGINDIYGGFSLDDIYKNYIKLIDTLRSKKIVPVIQSTLYVSTKWHDASTKNLDVEKLNKLLQEYAIKNKILYLDLNSKLIDGKFLKDEFTYDGVHLTWRGYKIWGQELEKVLKMLGI
ncbi:MAG: GDSL-type esterase/lipase family protein [Ignavibacteriales bacterium]|nr:GDSL-type esterase/lipase family protein [Ignavibacteriales bacterium]